MGESLRGLHFFTARPARSWQSQLDHLNEYLDGIEVRYSKIKI
jgi:hypothetical protein